MATIIDNIQFYHTLSKSPVHLDPTNRETGNSVNRGGHILKSSDVWTTNIPWCYYYSSAPQSSEHNVGDLYFNSTQSKWYQADVDNKWQLADDMNNLADGSYCDIKVLGKNVLRYYKNVELSMITATNNNNQGSNGQACGYIQNGKLTQIIQATDKVSDNGKVSLGYVPKVRKFKKFKNETIEESVVEGSDYIVNGYAGVIIFAKSTHYNLEETDTWKMSFFEYIGETLETQKDNLIDKYKESSFSVHVPSTSLKHIVGKTVDGEILLYCVIDRETNEEVYINSTGQKYSVDESGNATKEDKVYDDSEVKFQLAESTESSTVSVDINAGNIWTTSKQRIAIPKKYSFKIAATDTQYIVLKVSRNTDGTYSYQYVTMTQEQLDNNYTTIQATEITST